LRQIVPGLAAAGITGHNAGAEPDDYAVGMPTAGQGGRYHHGDLRAALIDTAVDLIGERGVRHFSLAEASRRLGVAVSAPCAHFSDRDDLLAAGCRPRASRREYGRVTLVQALPPVHCGVSSSGLTGGDLTGAGAAG
jgi:hypothetical protein